MTIRMRLLMSVLGIALLAAAPTSLAAQGTPAAATAADRKRADALFLEGKTEDAKAIYLRLAASFADDFEFNKRLGFCFINSAKKDFAESAKYYARAYQLKPHDPEVAINLGNAYFRSNQFKAAVPVFQGVVARDPTNRDAWIELARAQYRSAQAAQARQSYQYYVDHWYSDRDARLEYASILAADKLYEPALVQYRLVMTADPNNFVARLGEAKVLSWQGKLPESLADYDSILKRIPDQYEALVGKGFTLLWMQRYDDASRMFAESSRQKPADKDIQEALNQIARAKIDEQQRQTQAEIDAIRQQAEEAVGRNDYARAIVLLQQAAGKAPQDFSLRTRIAQVYGMNHQWDQAIETLQKFYAEHPENLAALLELANAQMESNRVADAAKTYQAYLQRSPNPAVRMKLAQALSWSGQFDDAIRAYREVVRSEPNNFEAVYGLAQTLSWSGNLGQALETYDAALALQPGNRDAQLGRARALYWDGHLDKAIAALEPMHGTWPEDREIAALLQSIRDAVNQEGMQAAAPPTVSEDPEEMYRKNQEIIAQNPKDAKALETLGDLSQRKNNNQAAISYYERAVDQQPQDAALRLKLARVASWEKEYPRSISSYQALLSQEPDNHDARIELAKVLSAAGRNSESIDQYREALKRTPGDSESRLGLARVLSWNKQYDDSVKEYERVLESKPENHDALIERARVLGWNGQMDESLQAYDDILIHSPQDRDALFGKAQTLYWAARPREAKPILEELHAKYPDDRNVALVTAGVESTLGEKTQALRQLDELDKLQPGNSEVVSMRNRIRQDLRPTLTLGFTPSVDNEDLSIYSATSTLNFNPTPQIRSYLFVGITPSRFVNQSQTGRELLFGSYGRVTDHLVLRGEVGGDSANSGRQGVIGGGGATFFVNDRMQFNVDASRRFINYIPRPVVLGISRVEFRAAWDWRPLQRSAFHMDYYHQRYSDSNRNNGGDFTILESIVQKDRLQVETGYLYSTNGFTKTINSGYFAPSRLQRHGLLFNVQGKLAPKIQVYFWGSFGGEQIDSDPFRLDGTARTEWDMTLSNHFKLGMGYGYFNVASAVTAGAYRTHTGYLTMEFRF